jgi:hypothetical protein
MGANMYIQYTVYSSLQYVCGNEFLEPKKEQKNFSLNVDMGIEKSVILS